MGYYLDNGIYPSWSIFVKTISYPQGIKKIHFARHQEACRKDVARAFTVLQASFGIVHDPARFCHQKRVWHILAVCVCDPAYLIIEDEREQPQDFYYENEGNKMYIPSIRPHTGPDDSM